MTKAYSYVRFSSKKQELGHSLKRQNDLIAAYVAKHKLILSTESYKDLGVSAFKGKNALEGSLNTFIKAVESGVIEPGSILLIEAIDRISRQEITDALYMFIGIIRLDIKIVTLDPEAEYSRENTNNDGGMSLMISIQLLSQAHKESVRKSSLVGAKWASKRKDDKILTKNGLAWMRLNEKTREWELIPERVATVQRIFSMALEGGGTGGTTIARVLNAENVPVLTDGRKRKGQKDDEELPPAKWSPQGVNYVLRNRGVLGEFNPKRRKNDVLDAVHPDRKETLRTDYYEPIIDPVVFQMVQEKMDGRKSTGGRTFKNFTNVLSNVGVCECGSKLRLVSSNPEYPYLKCIRSYNNGGCDAQAVPYNLVENALFEYLMFIEEHDFDHRKVVNDPRVVLRAELAEKQHALNGLNETVMKGGVGAPKAVMQNMIRLEAEIESLEKTIANTLPPSPLKERAKNAAALLQEYQRFSAMRGRHDDPAYIALRERLKNGLVGLVDDVFFLKREKHFNGPDEQTTFRYAVVKGPLISALLDEDGKPLDGVAPSLYEDGGFLLEYELTAWGDKKSRRRAANRAS